MRPQPAVDHVGQHDLAEVEDAAHVDREHLLELLLADLEEPRERRDAGVVDQDRRRTEPLADLGDTGFDLVTVAHVDGDTDRRAAVGHDGVGGRVGTVAVAVEDGDGCAVLGEPRGDGDADAGATAGDDRGAGG